MRELPQSDAKHSEFSKLQTRVQQLPQELEDMVLFWLIEASLHPGKIFLDGSGRACIERISPGDCRSYDKPYPSILLALNKKLLPQAASLLYRENTFVLPSGPISEAFFYRWARMDLRRFPSVELRAEGLNMDCFACTYDPSKSSKIQTFWFQFHSSMSCALPQDRLRRYLLAIWYDKSFMIEKHPCSLKTSESVFNDFPGISSAIEAWEEIDQVLEQDSVAPRREIFHSVCPKDEPQAITFSECGKRRLLATLWRLFRRQKRGHWD